MDKGNPDYDSDAEFDIMIHPKTKKVTPRVTAAAAGATGKEGGSAHLSRSQEQQRML